MVGVISEHFVEAANAASVDALPGADEWAVFSVECRVVSLHEFESRARPARVSGTLVVLEGTRFWVREDAVDADHSQPSRRLYLRPPD